MTLRFDIVALLLLMALSPVAGQESGMIVTDETFDLLGSHSGPVTLQFDLADDIEGWGVYLCNDRDEIRPRSVTALDLVLTSNGGEAPFFEAIDFDPDGVRIEADLLEGIDLIPAGILEDVNDGDGPDLFGEEIGVSGRGMTAGVLYSIGNPASIEFLDPEPILTAIFETTGLSGDYDGGQTTTLEFESVGIPAVENYTVDGTADYEVDTSAHTFEFVPIPELSYVRGDCDLSGEINLLDVITMLDELFGEGAEGSCPSACDIGDDGFHNLADAIHLLAYLFLAGFEPAPPFPDCGVTGAEGEDCEDNPNCV